MMHALVLLVGWAFLPVQAGGHMGPPLQVKIHGHRGCRGLRPENTLPAFRHAFELGVDVLELDLGVTADNHLLVSHDPYLTAAWTPSSPTTRKRWLRSSVAEGRDSIPLWPTPS